ncbi:MAG TPA: membrane protein insertion efficiency factor YidD [Candidatus Azoamicus sp. OHIO2]
MNNITTLLIKFYKYFISPFLPSACRFYPTCSIYAIIALSKYNYTTAIFLICKRVLKCNPFFKGGYDPL